MNSLLILFTVLAIGVVIFLIGWCLCSLMSAQKYAELCLAAYHNGRREGYKQAAAVAVQVIRTGQPDLEKCRN